MRSPVLVKAAIYLDSNAGAPLSPAAAEVLLRFLTPGGLVPNPSSIHSHGRLAKRSLAEARERVSSSLGKATDPEQLVFTSSGTEANQLVIRSVFEPLLARGENPHWITSSVEHDSVKQMVPWLESKGGKVSILPVDALGVPQLDDLFNLMNPNTALVSVVWANNETGVITDIQRLAELTRTRSIPLHLDGAQAWGKIPFQINELGAQFVTFSGHKIGGLAGSGAVWLGRGHPVQATLLGKQEKGRRGGTENLMGIVAMGAAAQGLAPEEWVNQVGPLRDRLQDVICNRIPGTWVNGAGAPRIANTLNLSFEGVEGDGLVMALDLAGYSVSSGSACASGVLEPSHVLLAMGRTKLQAMAAVRVSLTPGLHWENLEGFVNALENAVIRVRKASIRNTDRNTGYLEQ